MASRALFGLLLFALCFSHTMIFSKAVPITRTETLMHGNLAQGRNNQIWDDPTVHINARIDVELQDYPGSGANNRHTPKSQFGRCTDC